MARSRRDSTPRMISFTWSTKTWPRLGLVSRLTAKPSLDASTMSLQDHWLSRVSIEAFLRRRREEEKEKGEEEICIVQATFRCLPSLAKCLLCHATIAHLSLLSIRISANQLRVYKIRKIPRTQKDVLFVNFRITLMAFTKSVDVYAQQSRWHSWFLSLPPAFLHEFRLRYNDWIYLYLELEHLRYRYHNFLKSISWRCRKWSSKPAAKFTNVQSLVTLYVDHNIQ